MQVRPVNPTIRPGINQFQPRRPLPIGRTMRRLGEMLLREQLITDEQLRIAESETNKTGKSISASLVRTGAIDEEGITQFLSQKYGVPAINLEEFDVDDETLAVLNKDVANLHRVVPVSRAGSSLIVAIADPANMAALDDVKFATGYNIEVVVASEMAISAFIEKYYNSIANSKFDFDEMLERIEEDDDFGEEENENVSTVKIDGTGDEAPVVRLANHILLVAIERGASDIHIEPYETSYRVRYRVDGVLSEGMQIPLKLKAALSSRIKIMAQLDIAERRIPQDGRIKLKIGDKKQMDFRVSSLPTLFGEKIVLRLLDKGNLQLDMTKLGFEQGQLDLFKDAIHKPFGMVLVTGPTGSGKTTTLYSALQELNQITENISTAEDPVEFNLAGINQVQMAEDVGLSFASALRSFLRQDPDIVMIGEVRDFETAEIAIKAALTGHMVLSTLHTNDAPSTITRLLNMGIEPFLVTAAVNLVEAQRLVRRICPDCKQPIETPKDYLRSLGASDEDIDTAQCFEGVGCSTCGGSGYKGRVAVYECMAFNEPLKELVIQGATATDLKAEAIKQGMRTLRMSGIRKACEGMTSADEVARVTMAD